MWTLFNSSGKKIILKMYIRNNQISVFLNIWRACYTVATVAGIIFTWVKKITDKSKW